MIPLCFSAWRGRLLPATVALTLLLALGCQKSADLPPTHPVSGKVIYTDGRPLRGGTIQFASSPPDPLTTITGVIDNDGHFTLSTIKGQQKVAGAVEGQYQVTIIPSLADGRQAVMPITLPGTYTVKAGENTFPDFKIRPQTSAARLR
jgi:hypothetical protein